MLIAMAQNVPKVPAADEGRWRICVAAKRKRKPTWMKVSYLSSSKSHAGRRMGQRDGVSSELKVCTFLADLAPKDARLPTLVDLWGSGSGTGLQIRSAPLPSNYSSSAPASTIALQSFLSAPQG